MHLWAGDFGAHFCGNISGQMKFQQAHRPNPYKLAVGLLNHPDRQLSGTGHAGR
jgi:hypothetical protein